MISSLNLTEEFVDPLNDSTWDKRISAYPSCSIFHSSSWARVLHMTYGHVPVYCRLLQNDKEAALLPVMEVDSRFSGRRGVCLPFSDVCEPLISRNIGRDLVANYLSGLVQRRGWKHLEIRGGDVAAAVVKRSKKSFYEHKLQLEGDLNTLFSGFTSSARRAIRKAENSGLTVRVSCSEDSMRDFFRLHTLTRKRHGLPPQPYTFFQNIFNEIILQNAGKIVVASGENGTVAAAVFFYFNKTAVYKFGASDETFWKMRPNNLVMWEGIRFLIQEGIKVLHFGRTSSVHSGLRRFKLSWGTKEEPVFYARYCSNLMKWVQTTPGSAKNFNNIFRMMPSGLNVLMGRMIYPHLD